MIPLCLASVVVFWRGRPDGGAVTTKPEVQASREEDIGGPYGLRAHPPSADGKEGQ